MDKRKLILGTLAILLILNFFLLTNEEQKTVSAAAESWTEIRSATESIGKTTATGIIEPVAIQSVAVRQSGNVNRIVSKTGDVVPVGSPIILLDSSDYEQEVNRSTIELQMAQNDLEKLKQGNSQEDITTAQSDLLTAQQNLAKVQAGTTAEELASAEAALTAAQAKYNDLFKGPSQNTIAAAKAEVNKAQAEVDRAQHAYNRIKNNPDYCYGACSQEGEDLQKATESYNAALANYNKLFEPPSAGTQQAALAEVTKAESDLLLLKSKPFPSELAEAQSRVTTAEQRLKKLQQGASSYDIQASELRVQKAKLDIDIASQKLNETQIVAPVDGTLLDIKTSTGDYVANGTVVATIADLSQLKLSTKVPQSDISKIRQGQTISVSIDALNDQTLEGVIKNIAPEGKSTDGINSYTVDIYLTGLLPEALRPGMTGLAMLTDPQLSNDSWLIPQNSIRGQSERSTVRRVRNGEISEVTVTTKENHGEWTLVHSNELQKGDQVVGSVTTKISDDTTELLGN